MLQHGFNQILKIQKENELIRCDKILSQAYDANNTDEFFQVQVRRQDKRFGGQPGSFEKKDEYNQYSYGGALAVSFHI